MSQMSVVGYRLCAANTPEHVMVKAVGDEMVRQIRADAVKEMQGKLERAQMIERKYKAMMPEHEAQVMRRAKRKPLIRRILAPVELAWAFAYACAVLWPVAIAYKLIGWAKRKGLDD